MKNYIDLGKNLLGTWEHYVYLDTPEILAKSLFVRHMVALKPEGVMTRENEKYCLVAVKVQKKDKEKFLRSMEELKGKMLLFGHTDYESRGGELMDMTRDIIRAEAEKTGKVELPTGGTVRAETLPEL